MHDHIKTTHSSMHDSVAELYRSRMTEDRVDALKALIELVLRELETLQQMTDGPWLTEDEALSLPDQLSEIETRLIQNALMNAGGNQRTAAALLGIRHTTLHAKLRRYKIDPQAFSAGPPNRPIVDKRVFEEKRYEIFP